MKNTIVIFRKDGKVYGRTTRQIFQDGQEIMIQKSHDPRKTYDHIHEDDLIFVNNL